MPRVNPNTCIRIATGCVNKLWRAFRLLTGCMLALTVVFGNQTRAYAALRFQYFVKKLLPIAFYTFVFLVTCFLLESFTEIPFQVLEDLYGLEMTNYLNRFGLYHWREGAPGRGVLLSTASALIVAFSYPSKWLDKNAIDLVYYSVGILSVAAFVYAQENSASWIYGEDRQIAQLQADINRVTSYDTSNDLQAIQWKLQRLAELQIELREAVRSRADIIDRPDLRSFKQSFWPLVLIYLASLKIARNNIRSQICEPK